MVNGINLTTPLIIAHDQTKMKRGLNQIAGFVIKSPENMQAGFDIGKGSDRCFRSSIRNFRHFWRR